MTFVELARENIRVAVLLGIITPGCGFRLMRQLTEGTE